MNHDKEILLEELKQSKFKNNYQRKNVGVGKSNVFGMITKNRKCTGICKNNEYFPGLYKLICEFGKKYCPVSYTAIQVNHNYNCNPHLDKNNIGDSWIISLGDYTGGELNIQGTKHNIRNGLVFDGSKSLHWTEPFDGNRYSLVYFTSKINF